MLNCDSAGHFSFVVVKRLGTREDAPQGHSIGNEPGGNQLGWSPGRFDWFEKNGPEERNG